MNNVEDKGNKFMTKISTFLRFMRYVALFLVTIWLTVLIIASAGTNDIMSIVVYCIPFLLYYITIPIIGFWIYSFVKSIIGRTKGDKIFLLFHLIDLLMIGIVSFLLTLPSHNCDAFIMADQYKGENGFWMRNIANHYRSMLPDSTRLCFEINDDNSNLNFLSKKDTNELIRCLKDCGCIGIDVDNYTNKGYSTIRFRRIGMGMYSYRFYHRPLTHHEQDSINNDMCLIVYNDSTVFEFGGGVFGVQHFVGKEEYMEYLRNTKIPISPHSD